MKRVEVLKKRKNTKTWNDIEKQYNRGSNVDKYQKHEKLPKIVEKIKVNKVM